LVEECYLYLTDNEDQLDAGSQAHLDLYRALKTEKKEVKLPDKEARPLHQSEFLRGCKGQLSEAEYAELLRSRRKDVDFKPKMD
jgi:hypothetical protein